MISQQPPLNFATGHGKFRSLTPRVCKHCLNTFETIEVAQRYCSEQCRRDASNKRRLKAPEHWTNQERQCKQCGQMFRLQPGNGPNRAHCSAECTRKTRRLSTEAFYRNNPGAQSYYNRRRGKDTLIVRLYKKFPTLPTTCEATECGENRVVEIAHKPGFERKGAWRAIKNCERHMFWILCPTHHKLVDRGICAPAELGLS